MAALLCVCALLIGGAGGQPAGEASIPSQPLQGRVIRVGLPGPLGARGMLRGSADDPQGFLRELMVQIAEVEGFTVEFVPLDKEGGLDHREELSKGHIDVLAGATVGDGNLRLFRLSAPVVITPGVAVTRKGTAGPTAVEALRQLKVAVPMGGAGRTFAMEQNIAVSPQRMFNDGFNAVVTGEADAFLTTQLAANFEIERLNYATLQASVLEPVGFRRAYAYAVRTDDALLMLAIEAGLLRLEHDGRFRALYQREVGRYQPLDGPSSIPVSTVVHFGSAAGVALLVGAALWQWRTHRRLATLTHVLADSEARYRGIFDHSEDSILLVDPGTGRILEANPAAERMYGYGPGELTGVAVADLVVDSEAVPDRIRQVSDEKSIRVARSRHRRRDGRTIIADVHAALGSIGGKDVIVSMSRDVTAAASREDLVRSVIESSPHVAIQGFDRAGRVTFWNDASERLYGWTAAEATGRQLSELIMDQPAQADVVALFAELEAQRRSSGLMEFKARTKSGEVRWVLSEIVPATDPQGEQRFVCVDIDVTEARQRAADADKLRDELERARRLESLGLLAGGLAHDFNNLLVGIRGNSEIAMRSVDENGPAHRAMELVVQATDRTAELTQQLLAAAGRSRLEPEPVDLNRVAVESVELLRSRLGERVDVAFDMAEPAVRTRADSAQTRQAVSNLLTNAADALENRRGARITVRTGVQRLQRGDFDDPAFKVRSAPGDYAFIEVTDNGAGMDERVLARIFDPFYSTKATGRGLGLSLVMMTVRRHEGAIRVESRPGEGTVCRLLLPLVAVDERGAAEDGRPAAVVPGAALVIDDEPMVRSVIASMLRQEGWRVHESASGEEGVRAAAGERFDVAFVDLTMPGMSGVETAAALRAVLAGLPVVFVSGYNREMAEATGALDGEVFVQKPFDGKRLIEAVGEALAKKRGGR